MRFSGILDQDAYDEQICEINSSCYDDGLYTFALSTGYLIDNFDLTSGYTEDKFVVLMSIDDEDAEQEYNEDSTDEDFDEELEDFENSILTETIIIPFSAISAEFDPNPEIL